MSTMIESSYLTHVGPMAVRVRGSGPVVVLVHGIPGSGAVWNDVAAVLARRHTVLAPDLLGFAASARPDDVEMLWVDAQADALAAVIERWAPSGAAVVGHDYGGPVALALVRRRPDLVTQLALCATNAFTDTPVPFPLSLLRWPLVRHPVEHVLFSSWGLRMMLRSGSSVKLDSAIHVGDRRQQAAIRRLFATALRELPSRYAAAEETLARVTVPTLVVWGDGDPFFGVEQARRTADAITAARLTVYEGCGHFVPAERAERLAADLAALVA